jgi:hypothetical protein
LKWNIPSSPSHRTAFPPWRREILDERGEARRQPCRDLVPLLLGETGKPGEVTKQMAGGRETR